jgi:hypothetical protein
LTEVLSSKRERLWSLSYEAIILVNPLCSVLGLAPRFQML